MILIIDAILLLTVIYLWFTLEKKWMTVYVGFDQTKSMLVNYFYCDGVADDVQINAAEAYVTGLGGGSIMLEAGTYNIEDSINISKNNVTIAGYGGYVILDGNKDNSLIGSKIK